MINAIHGIRGWRTLVVAEAGKIRLLDCAPAQGQPVLLAETALDLGRWPVGMPGLADTRLPLGDSRGRNAPGPPT